MNDEALDFGEVRIRRRDLSDTMFPHQGGGMYVKKEIAGGAAQFIQKLP